MRSATACLAAALALAVGGCSRDDGPALEGHRYRETWEDLTGRVRGTFELGSWSVARGEALELSYQLRIELSGDVRRNLDGRARGLWVAWSGERLFDAGGHYRQMQNALSSTTLTTTGMPVETAQPMAPSRELGHVYGTPFDGADHHPLPGKRTLGTITLSGTRRWPIDGSVPDGLYRLGFEVVLDLDDGRMPGWGLLPFVGDVMPRFVSPTKLSPRYLRGLTTNLYPQRLLPLVEVGEVREPHMPWVLFADGERGEEAVVAREDRPRFAVSSRIRYPTRRILAPGRRDLSPIFITAFPGAAAPPAGGASLVPGEVDHHLDLASGHVTVRVTEPDGTVHELGRHAFAGPGRGGPRLAGEPPSFDFQQGGHHVIELAGVVRDVLGREISGGGTYDVWVGRQLTFSTTVKHGLDLGVGASFPFKAEVNPPFPADVRYAVRWYPASDPARERKVEARGRANPFGYFHARPDDAALVFDEPGEYRADLFAAYVDGRGQHWYGSQTAAAVVFPADPGVSLHGVRMPADGPTVLDPASPTLGYEARWQGEESGQNLSFLEMVDCHDRNVPFRAGDVLHFSSTYSRDANISAELALGISDPLLRTTYVGLLPRSRYLMPFAAAGRDWSGAAIRPLALDQATDTLYLIDGLAEGPAQLPILSLNGAGLHPSSFPEENVVEAYTYTNVIRPGFSAFVMASDSTATGPYWSTGDTSFGGQAAAGVNGDMPNDLYLVRSGLVVKDLIHHRTHYAGYASAIAVGPGGSRPVRVTAADAEPLFTVNGLPQWLTLGMASNLVLTSGDLVSLSAGVIPPVPAEVEVSMRFPSGRVVHHAGRASALGGFAVPPTEVAEPGVYLVEARARYGGHEGDVLGSGDGVFHHYVVPRDRRRILEVALPPVSAVDPESILTIPVRVPAGYRSARLSWSMIMPGMILDEGSVDLETRAYDLRFLPSQFAMQFPNFDATDYRTGLARMNDLVSFILFLEATDPAGERVQDARRLVLREGRLYHFDPDAEGPPADVHPTTVARASPPSP